MSYKPTPKQALLLWRLIAAETEAEREPMISEARPELTPTERAQLVQHGLVDLEQRGKGRYYILTDKAWATAAETVDVEILKSRSTSGAEALQGVLRQLLAYLKRHDIPLASVFSHQPRKSADEALRTVSSSKAKSRTTTKSRSKQVTSQKAEPRSASKQRSRTTTSTRTKSPSTPKRPRNNSASLKARSRATTKQPSKQVPSSKPRPQPASREERKSNGLAATIERACIELAGGIRKQRVRLTALRQKLNVERDVLNAALLDLQDQGRLVLYRDDNSSALTKEDHDAALIVGGAPRHLVYLEA